MRLLLLLLLATFTSAAIGQNRRSLGGAFMHASPLGHNGEGMRGGGPPANDDCTDAQSVSVAADCSAPIDGNNAEATDDGPDATCDDPGSELLDVWYSFNSGAESAVWITLTPSANMTDHVFVVYDGCAGTEIFCLVTPAAPAEVTVAPNTDYWVRVHSNLDYGVGGAFTLCISTEVNIDPPPPNDLCTGATPQSLAIGDTVTYNGDNSGATDSEGLDSIPHGKRSRHRYLRRCEDQLLRNALTLRYVLGRAV
ncbi:MAG: hypothetical protein IPK99_16965 [Flavobacteriales bacterium]|nr:hypothetical protein [Flavobacteriales bacterium]